MLAFCVGALLLVLLVQGVSVHAIGASGTPRAAHGRAPLAHEGPFFGERGGRLVPRGGLPARTVALTFDDGPDPRWTRRIAAYLRGQHVTATFFVIGSQAARHPGLVRRLHRDGFELGNHTFTHADLAGIPGWQRSLQVGMTESALAGSAGVRPRLVRPPYSSTPDAVTVGEERALADVASHGYVIVLSTLDGRDWARPGVADIVRAATPRRGQGGVILLHDGGGNRSETLAAVTRLVPRLRRQGYRFVPVSQLAGLRTAQAEPPATGSQDVRGRLLVVTLAVARAVTDVLGAILIAIAVLAVARALLLFALARRHVREVRRQPGDRSYAPGVSWVYSGRTRPLSVITFRWKKGSST